MKKMNLFSSVLVGLSSVTLGATSILAAEGTKEDPIKAQTEATVLFESDDEDTPPVVVPPIEGGDKPGVVDDKPGNSDGSQGNGTNSFNIAWVSNFRFNDRAEGDTDFTKFAPIALNANGMTLWAKGTKLTIKELDEDANTAVYNNIPNFVQVVDNRGKNSGWLLRASMTEFKGNDADGVEQTLKSAELSLNNLSSKGPQGITTPTFADSIVLNSDVTDIMKAEEEAGMGSWSLNMGDSNADGTLIDKTGVKLTVPAGAKTNVAYSANINWTLTDAPAG